MEERIKNLRKMGMLVKVYHGRLKNPSEHCVPWKSQRIHYVPEPGGMQGGGGSSITKRASGGSYL